MHSFPPGFALTRFASTTSDIDLFFFFLTFYFFFSFLAALQHMEFLGQGSDPNPGCDNSRSLTHCARLGIEPESQCSRDACRSHCATVATLAYIFLIIPEVEINALISTKVPEHKV